MNNQILRRTTLVIVMAIIGVSGVIAQTPQLQTSSRQVRNVLDRIRTGAANLQREITRATYDNAANNADERVADQLTALTTSANSLRTTTAGYSRNPDVSTDLNSILDRASRINRIISRNVASPRVTSQWATLKTDINTLAAYYGMTANWETGGGWNNNNGNNGGWNNNRNASLTGTYRLNASQSDNVTDVIDRSVGSYSNNQRDNVRRTLERRLASPDVIAIEKNGRSISMGSSNQAQVTFDADGVARTETGARGRTITTRVTSTGNNFTIDYSGDRVNDFNVIFDVDRNGRLRVTRKIYLEDRNDTVSVSSVYDRISTTADWTSVRQGNDTYGNNNGNNGNNGTAAGGFYIPNNVSLTATLRNTVSTKVSQIGDRFTLDVTSPNAYRGAVIEGRISEKGNSGRVSGRANVQMDFETISMNGRTYQFAGIIQSVSAANGDSVTVNNEGTIRDSSQTNKTATRAGIGAVLGAIIGAVAGGGSGAAIGAGVGAGAGAGTVLLGGKDSIELGQGSTFTILSSAPANASYNPRN